jgi:hypothetical protein
MKRRWKRMNFIEKLQGRNRVYDPVHAQCRVGSNKYEDLDRLHWSRDGYSLRELPDASKCAKNVTRIDRNETLRLDVDAFRERFERSSEPVILTDLDVAWPARTQWTRQRLLETYGEYYFKVGESDSGSDVTLKARFRSDTR